jgi:exodeoxyribonuclease V gamma subunit
MRGFGEMAAAQLTGTIEQMLAYHFRLREQFPHKVKATEIDLAVKPDDCGCSAIQDWLTDLYRADPDTPLSESERCARWQFYPHTIVDRKGQFSRLDSLIPPWVYHLAGCARGLDLTSYLVAPDGLIRLPPLGRDPARRWMDAIIEHWWSGLQQPLPMAAKTALAYLRVLHSDPDADPNKALETARSAYQGNGYNSFGELGYSPYLQRIYPAFDDIWQADGNRFTTLAEALYAPLVQSCVQEQ